MSDITGSRRFEVSAYRKDNGELISERTRTFPSLQRAIAYYENLVRRSGPNEDVKLHVRGVPSNVEIAAIKGANITLPHD